MTAPHVSDKSHKLQERFSEAEHTELRGQDSEAWQGVVAILLLIVSVGLVLAVITLTATS
jgi:hypothetical protein